MHALSALLLVLGSTPIVVFAGHSHHESLFYYKRATARSTQSSSCNRATNSSYKLTDLHQGSTFFDGWDFFTGADPTHGNVAFLSQKDAQTKGLAVVQSDNTTVISVDDTSSVPKGGNRNSVRISTKKTYSSGLFIADFNAMPTGCGVWPAWWSVGQSWPNDGEIDIIEGVNNQPNNQYTLHTGSTNGSCTLDKSINSNNNSTSQASAAGFTSNVLGTQCVSSNANNAGCSFSDPSPSSFGAGFNNASGGVFAHLWDSTGIKVWRFSRSGVPSDITARAPNPAGWGTPAAAWSSATCDIASHFFGHVLTLDTTICGDWAGDAYAGSGCPGTCADVVADASNFSQAKWKVNYIAVYQ